MRRTIEAVTVINSRGILKNTLTLINNAAADRNPAVWKKRNIPVQRRATLSDSPALYFNPDRWLGTDDGPDDAKGALPAWHAFGAGSRACPGRTFAQIELTSVIATLLEDYSLELIIDKTLQECHADRIQAQERTKDKGIKMMYDDIEANISISMMKELPIRIVKRRG